MTAYIARRVFQAVFVIIGVTLLAFFIMFLTGDPTYLLLGDVRGMTQVEIEAFRHEMGFDRPVAIQYWDYMKNAIRGDLGKSYYHRVPNMELILERMPATLQLALTGQALAILIAVPLGVYAAVHRNTIADHLTMVGALLGQSVPVFWLGLLMILLFSVELRWFPVSGYGTLRHLVLPAITLGAFSMARIARLTRSTLLEVLSEDYINTARAKGLSERVVIYKHALRNAMIPVVTIIGLSMGMLLGGAVITESIFAWPGVGRMILTAIQTKDLPLVQSSVIVLSSGFVGINLLVDIMYGFLDPRIRYD